MEITSIDAVLIELVMRVARSYYAAHFIIILDLLALRGPTHEKTVAAALRISPVDTRKLCKRLETDRLIKANSRSIETKYGKHTKKHTETYYYIDYKSLINVIKYRFFKMQEVIKKEIEDHNNNLAYECPKCRAKFDPYTVLRMIRPEDGMFACENCQSILEQEKGTDFGNDLSTRFNVERMEILKLLQQTESHTIPDFVPPSHALMAASNTNASAVISMPDRVEVELVDDAPGVGGAGDAEDFDTGFDDYESKVDDKDALMRDYYANLAANAAPPPVLSLLGGAGGSTALVMGGSAVGGGASGSGIKRDEPATPVIPAATSFVFGGFNNANKRQKLDEADSDEDEVFEEI